MAFELSVIGAGAAGLLAAGKAAECGLSVVLLEKNDRPGRKLAITGKGRCNVTNAAPMEEFRENLITNPRFVYSALSAFGPRDMMAFMEAQGVPLKVERGNRVFPVSDKAYDVVDALLAYCKKGGVKLRFGSAVTALSRKESGFEIALADGEMLSAKKLILATGGISYPLTGSTGDGYRFAEALGHSVVAPRGSLLALEALGDDQKLCRDMMGLSLKNAGVSVYAAEEKVYYELGELLFTHFGMSGPTVLSGSAYIQKKLRESGSTQIPLRISIDLKPGLSAEQLDKRLLREIEGAGAKNLSTVMRTLLPQNMIPAFLKRAGLDGRKNAAELSRAERLTLAEKLKNFEIRVAGARPVEEAVVTMGGVDVREINPKTMESKKVPGLYFAGELIDIDALTGGFNLQLAFSTAHAAATAAADAAAKE